MKYVHTNLICLDVDRIAKFYIEVFDCKMLGKKGKISGDWVDRGTGVKNAYADSINLLLPGYGADGPKMELFQYSEILDKDLSPKANRKGFGHIAFNVESVSEIADKVISGGGKLHGELVEMEFGSGTLTYIYAEDPEGNLIEVQNWKGK